LHEEHKTKWRRVVSKCINANMQIFAVVGISQIKTDLGWRTVQDISNIVYLHRDRLFRAREKKLTKQKITYCHLCTKNNLNSSSRMKTLCMTSHPAIWLNFSSVAEPEPESEPEPPAPFYLRWSEPEPEPWPCYRFRFRLRIHKVSNIGLICKF
jgi:hypothetical protein